MARKNTLNRHPVATAQSLGTSFTTDPTTISYLDNISYQIDATTSDAIGTFVVQGSIDYVPAQPNETPNAGHWVDMTLSGSPTLASANDDILIDMNQVPFTAVRLQYTRTSGTGAVTVIINAKQIGG